MTNIAIFASGNGSNAENIINYFATSPLAKVALILTDNPQAGVIKRAERLNVEYISFSRKEIRTATNIINFLRSRKIDYIVLAGFLSLIPSEMIENYRNRIINIHPSLLPKYGGAGMYGDNVHRAVIEKGEQYSGITIHAVDEKYDQGEIIAQHRIEVSEGETPESLAAKIHKLEHNYFPKTIEEQIFKLADRGSKLPENC